MKFIKNIFLTISLLPLISAIYIASLNINKTTSLRVLTWKSQDRSIAVWISLGAIIGYSLSYLNILSLNISNSPNKRRVTTAVSSTGSSPEIYNDNLFSEEVNELDDDKFVNNNDYESTQQGLYIERDFRDPSPTVSVPYKIISTKSRLNNRPISNPARSNSNSNSDIPLRKQETVNDINSLENDWDNDFNDEW